VKNKITSLAGLLFIEPCYVEYIVQINNPGTISSEVLSEKDSS
jgi:hypothetical protein